MRSRETVRMRIGKERFAELSKNLTLKII